MTSLNEFARKYCEHLTVLGYAVGTVKAELFFLNRFFKYLAEINVAELAAVTRDIMRDYQVHLYEELNFKGEPNGVAYQNNNLRSVKAFFRFLKENDYLPGDPAKDITYAKTPKRLPRSILSGPEAKKVIHAPNTKTILGYRDRAILEVLYSTGIRRAEVINLLLTDVDYQDGLVRVNSGKGNKDRVVPIGKIACRYIENYIKAIRPSLIRDPYNNHLFLSMKGSHLSKSVVGEIVKRYGKKRRSRRTSRRTPSGIRAPRSCSGTKRTSGTSRSCSATPRLSQRKCTHTSASRT